ncbi:DDB1- and CUL4-associated factor 6-like isoform X2 [Neocloeon triangulifer]|uniref:DDB1- and CUL4-associated factor 6-like isoform X2 n=1 Tax=Neocloeon triangulifer TaxID=2078957 RepID=UPI00286F8CDB|nr:DDB1- and CUL4-associated factor 6-like isoform X2 [Neocloeon triangulifer]
MSKMTSRNFFKNVCDLPYGQTHRDRAALYSSCKDSKELLQRMRLSKALGVHEGCVNTLCWNSRGDCILSGSDDQRLVITNCFLNKIVAEQKTVHRANIFSAKYLVDNDDSIVVSCSGEGLILVTDMTRKDQAGQRSIFKCHYGTTYNVQTVPGDCNTFLSCGEDGTVRFFDLRQRSSCLQSSCSEDVILSWEGAVTTMAVNQMRPYQLAVGCSDSTVRLFDRRNLITKSAGGKPDDGFRKSALCSFTAPDLENALYRVTSLKFSPNGDDMLVSYSADYLYLFNIQEITASAQSYNSNGTSTRKLSSKSAPPIKRLRLRGDWSDTGPNARPESEEQIAQVRPTLQATLMQRMTDVLARMLNDPATRLALGGVSENAGRVDTRRDNEPGRELNVSLPNPERVSPLPSSSTAGPSTSGERDSTSEDFLESDDEKAVNEEVGLHLSRTDVLTPQAKQKYVGHRNARTMIKEASFWGENYIMSGSDCGHVFVWDKHSAELVMLLEADKHVVNSLQPHPHLPLLATSGIDYDIKLWSPMAEMPFFDSVEAERLMVRNKIMLQETRDTITVPASFMIRMLACLNQIRRGES